MSLPPCRPPQRSAARPRAALLALLLAGAAGCITAGAAPTPASAQNTLPQARTARTQTAPQGTGGSDAATLAQYDALLADRGFSARALFEQGNAWLREGRVGWAVLNYERALWLRPRAAAVAAALAAAQERAGVTAAADSPWAEDVRQLRFDTYTWMGMGGLAMLCAGVVLLRVGDGTRRYRARPLILAGALLLCVAVDAAVLYWPDLNRAVIVEGPAAVRIAPAAAAAESFDLRAGEMVYLEDRFEAFDRVRTRDGRSGWVSTAQLAPVIVSAAEARNELSRAAVQPQAVAGS